MSDDDILGPDIDRPNNVTYYVIYDIRDNDGNTKTVTTDFQSITYLHAVNDLLDELKDEGTLLMFRHLSRAPQTP